MPKAERASVGVLRTLPRPHSNGYCRAFGAGASLMTRMNHRPNFRRVCRSAAGVLLLSFASVSAFALEAGEAPTMAGESAHIKPAGERAIGTQERPTIKKKAAEQARE